MRNSLNDSVYIPLSKRKRIFLNNTLLLSNYLKRWIMNLYLASMYVTISFARLEVSKVLPVFLSKIAKAQSGWMESFCDHQFSSLATVHQQGMAMKVTLQCILSTWQWKRREYWHR